MRIHAYTPLCATFLAIVGFALATPSVFHLRAKTSQPRTECGGGVGCALAPAHAHSMQSFPSLLRVADECHEECTERTKQVCVPQEYCDAQGKCSTGQVCHSESDGQDCRQVCRPTSG